MAEGAAFHVLGIGGSTRQQSKSLAALQAALRVAAEQGAETRLVAMRDLALPLWNSDVQYDAHPREVGVLLDAVRAADALIVCSPTYHGTVSGAVKNALDLLDFLGNDSPRYLGGKPVGLLGYGGASAMNTINALYHALRALSGFVVPTVAVLAATQFDVETATITDPAMHRRVSTMVAEMLDLAALRALRHP